MRRFLPLMLLLSFFTVGVKAQLLYKISGNGLEKPSYVVGIDRLINPQGVVQGISGIKEAMIATDQMYFETSPDSLSYLEAAYKMPAGKTLKTVLTPAQYASLNAFLKKYEGVGLESPHVQKRYGALSPLGLRAEMEKMLFLTERLCHIDIGSHYHRDAAGPYDNRALRSIDSQLRKQKWFEVQRTKKGNRYIPMQNRGKHKPYFDRYYSSVASTFDKIINTFKTQRTEQCEIVATLYSAWEDLLHSNKSFTDADIVNEVLNNWHESKKRISQGRWLSAIQWMRENGFAPDVRNDK